MTEPEQITEAEQSAVPVWMHRLASKIVLGNHGVGNAGVLIQRAFEERERELRDAVKIAEDALIHISENCDERLAFGTADNALDALRQALATRQDAPVTENSHEEQ